MLDLKALLAKILTSFQIRKLLWTGNGTVPFGAQTIQLDLSRYDLIEVHVFNSSQAGRNYDESMVIRKNLPSGFFGLTSAGNAFLRRTVQFNDAGVTFGAGEYGGIPATTIYAANDVYVPVLIYGIKSGG